MKQTLQPSNNQNHINSKEKNNLLDLLRNNKINNTLQAYLYQRGDQSTVENGGAKYIKVTEDGLYEKYIESPEEIIRNNLNIKKELEEYDTVFDLGPGGGKTIKHIDNKQLYRPIDVSAYVIDHIKKATNIHTEGTIGDRFTTKVFNESQGKKAYIIGKTIPNLSDEEIIQLTQSLQPTKNGKSKLVVSYFPDFEETEDNINKLLAIYGDPNRNNPYYHEESRKNISNFISGLFVSLGFGAQDIQQNVIYDKHTHTVILGIRIKKDTTIHTEQRTFTWKKDEFIPAIHSRRRSDQDVQKLLAKGGRERKQHKKDQRIAVDVFEKTDPNKINNIMKRIGNALIFLSLLGGTVVGLQNAFEKHEKTYFLEQKQQKIQKELSQTYTQEQISYFNNNIEETKKILKTFYGIQDDGYLNGLIWPYIMANPDLVEYIMQQKGSYGTISPINTEISEYIAMVIMKDQENHSFLEYFGNDDLGYKKFDPYIPSMLQTLQYYDSIQTINGSYKINPNQEIMIPASNYSQLNPDLSGGTKKEIGSGISRGGKEVRVFIVSYSPVIVNNSPSYKDMIATTDKDMGPSDMFNTASFIKNFLSYRHQTKYLARQTAQYLTDELNKNDAEIDKYGTLQRLPMFEHIIQEYVLHGGETKIYLQNPQIGEKVFNDLILTNQKILKYFKDHVAIDLQTMQKFPEYEQRHGKMALSRGESSAYRNNPDYQEANKNFYKRD